MSEKQKDNDVIHTDAERAADEFARGRGIIIGNAGFFPIEFIDENILAALKRASSTIIITAARAESLGLAASAFDAKGMALAEVKALADPTYRQPLPPLVAKKSMAEDDRITSALALAKHISLLPALMMVEKPPADWLGVSADALRHYLNAPPEVVEMARATLPLAEAENAVLIAFHAKPGGDTHLALMVGNPGDAPLTRVHSSCVTGDMLGSLRCDCGDQLKLALSEIKKNGGGLLLYLNQEGRGIGIANKLRAYALQEQGVDTYEANRMLGFDEDERDFAIAAAILKKLGIKKIRLLTNNPLKIEALEKQGITISERRPLIAQGSTHNHSYLASKASAGHRF